jgi:hypothetical protein
MAVTIGWNVVKLFYSSLVVLLHKSLSVCPWQVFSSRSVFKTNAEPTLGLDLPANIKLHWKTCKRQTVQLIWLVLSDNLERFKTLSLGINVKINFACCCWCCRKHQCLSLVTFSGLSNFFVTDAAAKICHFLCMESFIRLFKYFRVRQEAGTL